jgi:hypothetical protein
VPGLLVASGYTDGWLQRYLKSIFVAIYIPHFQGKGIFLFKLYLCGFSFFVARVRPHKDSGSIVIFVAWNKAKEINFTHNGIICTRLTYSERFIWGKGTLFDTNATFSGNALLTVLFSTARQTKLALVTFVVGRKFHPNGIINPIIGRLPTPLFRANKVQNVVPSVPICVISARGINCEPTGFFGVVCGQTRCFWSFGHSIII